MNALTSINSTLTMSSREIAELTGKRHDNVRADIDKMAAELSLTFQEKAEPSLGRPIKVILLPKRETLILVSGYSVVLRAKIIDRWQELEEQTEAPALPDFSNPAAAARAWAEQFEKRADCTHRPCGCEHQRTVKPVTLLVSRKQAPRIPEIMYPYGGKSLEFIYY